MRWGTKTLFWCLNPSEQWVTSVEEKKIPSYNDKVNGRPSSLPLYSSFSSRELIANFSDNSCALEGEGWEEVSVKPFFVNSR